MNQEFLDKWSDFAKNSQLPLQEMAELNAKTIQNLTYLKPEELAEIKKPEEFAEKNFKVVMENGHKMLDYMRESFQIIEKSMAGALKETKKKADAEKSK